MRSAKGLTVDGYCKQIEEGNVVGVNGMSSRYYQR